MCRFLKWKPQCRNKNDGLDDNKLLLYTVRTYLFWNLSEVVNETDNGIPLQRVIYTIDIYIAFIEQIVEYIERFNSSFTLLLVAEYKIYPLV